MYRYKPASLPKAKEWSDPPSGPSVSKTIVGFVVDVNNTGLHKFSGSVTQAIPNLFFTTGLDRTCDAVGKKRL